MARETIHCTTASLLTKSMASQPVGENIIGMELTCRGPPHLFSDLDSVAK